MRNENYPLVALGTWSWGSGMAGGDQVFGNHLDNKALRPVFDAAIENGFNLFDTAVVYGMGSSEAILGEFVKDMPKGSVILSTKFTPQIASSSKDAVTEMCEGSLKRLHQDVIDIYWIHNPMNVELYTPQLIPLIKSGKVKSVGLSNHNLKEIIRAQEILAKEGIQVSAIQNHFSLLYRSSEEGGILDYCKKNNITFFSYMVLEQGALSGKYDATHLMPQESQRGETYNPLLKKMTPLLALLKEMALTHQTSPSQIAIAWAIEKGTLPIIGATKKEQIEEMVKLKDIHLSQEEMNSLEDAAKKTGVDTRGSWEHPMA